MHSSQLPSGGCRNCQQGCQKTVRSPANWGPLGSSVLGDHGCVPRVQLVLGSTKGESKAQRSRKYRGFYYLRQRWATRKTAISNIAPVQAQIQIQPDLILVPFSVISFSPAARRACACATGSPDVLLCILVPVLATRACARVATRAGIGEWPLRERTRIGKTIGRYGKRHMPVVAGGQKFEFGPGKQFPKHNFFFHPPK